MGTEYGDRLRAARKIKGLTQKQLSDATGIPQSTISTAERLGHGSADTPIYAKACEVDAHWLATGEGNMLPARGHSDVESPYSRPNLRNLRQVPVIGSTQGGLPDRIWTDAELPVGVSDTFAECSTTDQNAFLCRVVGDSMSPRYRPGEFCLVEPNTEPEIEDDVLVRLATGETMLKRLLGRRGGLRLGSYNDDAVMTYLAEEVSWCYYVAHVVPARKIKHRIETEDYSGPDRRWVNMPGSPKRRKEDDET
jgi:phage repressor protein C with HTH and peptisase S24 domain